VILVSYLFLILGELVPKRVALAHAETLAGWVAIPMLWVARIVAPLVWLLQVSADAVTRLMPLSSAPQSFITEVEVRALISAGARRFSSA
jgi:putative hemolysin